MKTGITDRAMQMNIRLVGIEPAIWRRVLVPATLTLTELNAVLQGAMGWRDCHGHRFEINGRMFEFEAGQEDALHVGVGDEACDLLYQFLSNGMTFSYLYDFGDCWHHEVTIESDDVNVPARRWHRLPLCVDGKRACPPEDCGGVDGYRDLLDRLLDPEHPEHQAACEWVEGFKPEAFNVAQANALIGAMSAIYLERGWGFINDGT